MPIDTDILISLYGVTDKVAIVTGAGSGIGKATATLMAQAGARVVVADLLPDTAEQVAGTIRDSGGEAVACAVDVSNEEAVKAMVAAAVTAFGGIDILVNNAAYRPKADFFKMSVDEWDRMHAVNTRGTFLCMREAISVMRGQGRDRGGAIVNISTIGTAHPTIFNNTHYDSSKAGVNAITRTSAIEFAADNIRINAVMPGGVDTEGSRRMRTDPTQQFEAKGPMVMPGRMPFGAAQPIQLASAILFLASPAASYITGHILAVDGGYLVS